MSSIDMIKSILRVNFDIESKKDIIPCSMWAFLKNIVRILLVLFINQKPMKSKSSILVILIDISKKHFCASSGIDVVILEKLNIYYVTSLFYKFCKFWMVIIIPLNCNSSRKDKFLDMKLKNKNFIISLFMVILFLYFTPVCFSVTNPVSARLTCDNTCVKAGKSLKVKTFIDSDSMLNVHSFKFTIKYDDSKFIYNNFTAPRGTSRRNFNVKCENNLLYIEYMCKRSDLLINKNLNICNFTFDSSKDINVCTCKFEFLDFQITDSNKNHFSLCNLDGLSIDVESEAKPNCYLSKLVPSSGELIPEFRKDIFEYDVYVDCETSFIDFDIGCENEYAVSNISRRKLAAAGKDTKINIVVNDNMTKSKFTYIINVHRSDKPVKDKDISKNTCSSKKTSGILKKYEKSKSGGLKDKSKSYKSEDEGGTANIDNKDNGDESVSDYVVLDNNKSDESIKNNFDEKLIIVAFIILVLGGILIYKIIVKDK